MNSVFAKWASARNELVGKQQQAEDDESEENNINIIEKKKMELEQWRMDQIKSYETIAHK